MMSLVTLLQERTRFTLWVLVSLLPAQPSPWCPLQPCHAGWCFAYTCQKRLSAFWTYLPSYHTIGVNFTGTPSKMFRLWWPYADPSAEIVLLINFQYIPNRWGVGNSAWLGLCVCVCVMFTGVGECEASSTSRVTHSHSKALQNLSVHPFCRRFVFMDNKRINPLDAPPTIGDANGHGSYYWNQNTTEFYVKMRGGGSALEIRSESAVQVGSKGLRGCVTYSTPTCPIISHHNHPHLHAHLTTHPRLVCHLPAGVHHPGPHH